MSGTDAAELDVSVVLPVYNEATHLAEEIERVRAGLDQSPFTYEIIVVDDGSTDGSTEQLRDMEGIELIVLPENRGTGTARKIGTKSARGRVVVWTDVDMTYPNDEIPRLVKELDGFDQVVGARTSEQGTHRFARVPAKWLLRRLASYLAEVGIPDLNSGFRAFRRAVGEQFLYMLPKGFSCVSTMTMTFLANGYSVKYVPIEYRPRMGRSKFHWWTDTRRYLTQIIRLIMTYQPLRIFIPLGLALVGVGTMKLFFDLADHPFRVATNTLLIMFSALQFLVVGLLADLVVHLSRPREYVDPAAK